MSGEIMVKTEKLAYSVAEAAEQTSLSKAYIRKEIKVGHLKVKRFGRRVLILNKDLQSFLENGK